MSHSMPANDSDSSLAFRSGVKLIKTISLIRNILCSVDLIRILPTKSQLLIKINLGEQSEIE